MGHGQLHSPYWPVAEIYTLVLTLPVAAFPIRKWIYPCRDIQCCGNRTANCKLCDPIAFTQCRY